MAILPLLNKHNYQLNQYVVPLPPKAPVYDPWLGAPINPDNILWNVGLKLINVGIDPETLNLNMSKDPVNMSYYIIASFIAHGKPYKADFQIPEVDVMNGNVTEGMIIDKFFLEIKNVYYPDLGFWTQKFMDRML